MEGPSTSRIDTLLADLTLEEKAALMTGRGLWDTNPVERLGIPALKVTDGPNGARGAGLLGTGTPALCIPCGSALGATWDRELVEELGAVLAAETRARACHVLLAPTVNIHRTPLGGRNFECYSEDPVLTGRIAAAFIRGVQSGGVGTTIKHFVANDSEFERNSIDSVVPDRALREVYLRPFEIAVCASHVDCHEDDVRPAAVRRGRGRRLVLQHPLAGSWSPHSAALENPDQDDFHLDSA